MDLGGFMKKTHITIGKGGIIAILGVLWLFTTSCGVSTAWAGLNTIYGSYSTRTSRLEGAPNDWEVAFGFQTEKFLDFYVLTEQERGERFNGMDADFRTKFLSFSHHLRTAKDINSQSLKVGLPLIDWEKRWGLLGKKLDEWIGTIKIGGAMNWQCWENGRVLAFISVTAKYYRLSWETNFKDRRIYFLKAEVPISLARGFFLSPFSEIQQVNNKRNFWSKVKFGWTKKK